MNPLERIGLIRQVGPDPSQIPQTPVGPEVPADTLPEVSVDSIDIEAAVNEVYAQGSFNPETSIKRLTDFISTLPESLPEASKQLTISGILKATGIDINDLIDDGKARLDLIEAAKRTAQTDHAQLCTETGEEIAKLESYIEAAKAKMLESQNRTAQLTTAFDAELSELESLMTFATGVINATNPQPTNG